MKVSTGYVTSTQAGGHDDFASESTDQLTFHLNFPKDIRKHEQCKVSLSEDYTSEIVMS